MKSILLIFSMVAGLFSNATDPVETISPAAVESFQSTFRNAVEVDWTRTSNIYKVQFALDGQFVNAFYSEEGEMLAMTRNISANQLPIVLRADLKEYSGYWISDLFEISNQEGTAYYITLENADTKLVLKADSYQLWSTYKKSRKA